VRRKSGTVGSVVETYLRGSEHSRENLGQIQEINMKIEKCCEKMLSQYATLGAYDFGPVKAISELSNT